MSKSVRTVEQLQDALDAERAWRLKELSTLRKKLLRGASAQFSTDEDLAVLRPCVAMIYAHWEGFVKAACSAYLQYVAMQRLSHSELQAAFLALALRRQASEAGLSGPPADRFIVDFLRLNPESRGYIPYRGGVDTKSNLRFEVFCEIFESLNLSWREYELRQKQIDTQLVAKRNAIAHGRYIDLSASEVDELFETVIELLDMIKTQLLDAAINEQFRFKAA